MHDIYIYLIACQHLSGKLPSRVAVNDEGGRAGEDRHVNEPKYTMKPPNTYSDGISTTSVQACVL